MRISAYLRIETPSLSVVCKMGLWNVTYGYAATRTCICCNQGISTTIYSLLVGYKMYDYLTVREVYVCHASEISLHCYLLDD